MRRAFRNVFLGLDGILLLFFAAGYSASYVAPESLWWLQIIAPAVPYLSLAVLIATVIVLLLSRRRILVSVHLLCAVLILARFVSSESVGGLWSTHEEGLTMVTFNARKYRDDLPDTSSITDLRRGLRRLVQAESPQLIAFQEVQIWFRDRSPSLRRSNVESLVDTLNYSLHRPETLYGRVFIQPVLSRLPNLEVTQKSISGSTEEAVPESATRVVFKWDSHRVVLYNVHLHSFDTKPWTWGTEIWLNPSALIERLGEYREDYRIRAMQARRLRQMLERETMPLIVCGDFNSTPHNWVHRHISRGLTDAYKAVGVGWGSTYHARMPFARIDHILVSPHWRVSSAHVTRTVATDHLPLLATLVLRDM